MNYHRFRDLNELIKNIQNIINRLSDYNWNVTKTMSNTFFCMKKEKKKNFCPLQGLNPRTYLSSPKSGLFVVTLRQLSWLRRRNFWSSTQLFQSLAGHGLTFVNLQLELLDGALNPDPHWDPGGGACWGMCVLAHPRLSRAVGCKGTNRHHHIFLNFLLLGISCCPI